MEAPDPVPLDLARWSRVTGSWLGRSSWLPDWMKHRLSLVPHSPLSHGLSQMASLGASGSLGNMNSCACKATCALLCDCVCHCTECKTTCGLQGAASMSPLLPVETLSSHHGLRCPGLLTALTVMLAWLRPLGGRDRDPTLWTCWCFGAPGWVHGIFQAAFLDVPRFS